MLDPAAAGLKLDDALLAEACCDLTVGSPVPCPACSGSEFRRIARRDRYGFPLEYVACESCGLVFANPYYDADSLDRFYVKHYPRVYGRSARPDEMYLAEKARGRRVARLLRSFARTRGVELKSCIDLGCSHGGFLATLPSNWLRVGYDYDPSLFVKGIQEGLELRPIWELASEQRKFDVVMANQVLEHSHDALAFMRRLREFLAPGGVIYLEVPGIRSAAWSHIDVRLMFKNAHHYLFGADTLTRCAARVGLRPLVINEKVAALLEVDECAGEALSDVEGRGSASVRFIERRVREHAAGVSLGRRMRGLSLRLSEILCRLVERVRALG